MRLQIVIGAIVILLVGIFLGTFVQSVLFSNTDLSYIPTLAVTGDVTNPLQFTGLEDETVQKYTYKDTSHEGVSLQEWVAKADPLGERFDLLLVGRDGLTARYSGTNLNGCYITFTETYGWEAMNLNHPVSSNIKGLQEIIVVTQELLWDYGVNLITPEQNLQNVTPGQLLAGSYGSYLNFEGTSEVKKGDTTYQTSIFTRKRTVQVEDLLAKRTARSVLVVGAKGETVFHREGFLEVIGNQIHYLAPEAKVKIEDVRGMILNPTSVSNSDAYYDAQYYLEEGEPVLIILMDGFGFHQYQYALEHGFAPFLASLPEAKKALSVYQPVTNAGMAAIITGTGPKENGVYSRQQKDLWVPDIFSFAQQLGQTGILIEGDMKILNTAVEPIYNLDEDGNGFKDDEIFSSAQERLSEEMSLLFVHFHGIDESGHSHGDLALETLETIRETDKYIAQLVQGWSGKVILTADHGMHRTPEGGTHGTFRYEDLFVPYIITEGGKGE